MALGGTRNGRRAAPEGRARGTAPVVLLPAGARATRFDTGDGEVLVLSYPLGDLRAPEALSPAEGAVAMAIARGCSLAEVAHDRKTSIRTVANQVRAAYAKLGVCSRLELARALGAAR
jgi:DNA-binding NarL/FixJ family response regulator